MTQPKRSAQPDLIRLLALLTRERHALMRADMPELIRLSPRKEALLARLEVRPVNNAHALLRQVRNAAARNASLFEATLKGIQDARALIERCRTRGGDQTYARNGARLVVDPPSGTFERRA